MIFTKQSIGVFGGSFNPVHLGHLIMAQDAREIFGLAKVLFVPCNRPPHKDARGLAAAAHRLAMLAKAVAGKAGFEICELEIQRGGISYSIDTARDLRKIYRRQELFFIIGSDTLLELHLWKEINALLRLGRFVIFSRPGFDPRPAGRIKLPAAARKNLLKNLVARHAADISSSDIRRRLAAGLSIRYLVPPAVESYIRAHHLYGS